MSENRLYDSRLEQIILGCMLLDYGAWEAVQPLNPEHFYDRRHGEIYNAITSIVQRKKNPDPITVANELGLNSSECGGTEYFQALHDSVFSAKNVGQHAEILRNKAKERQLLAAVDNSGAIAVQETPIDERIESISRLYLDIAKTHVRQMPRHIQEICALRTVHYEAVQEGTVEPGWPTRIPSLDAALTGGFKPGKLVILAARPGVGKSSISWQFATCMASQGKKTLFLSMEMPAEEVADRAVSSMARVDYQALLTGKMSDDAWRYAGEALEEMRHLPLYVDDQPALTLNDVRTKARSLPDLKVLVVDYLQLMTGSGDNRNSQIEEISRGLKALAKELGICVIALSQLNREVEKRTNKRPNLSDLRDSGAIEQDADIVMFLWPVRVFPDGRKLIGLGVDKNRQGKQCEIALDFDGSIQRWGESYEKLYNEPAKQTTYSRGMPD